MARGTQVNVAVTRVRLDLEGTPFGEPWIQTVPRTELIHEFDHWEPEVQVLLQVKGFSRFHKQKAPCP